MKQALSSEGPARVRRGQLRAFTLGIGASALAMACSFGEIDPGDGAIDPVQNSNATDDDGVAPGDDTDRDPQQNAGTNDPADPQGSPSAAPAAPARPYDPDADPFSSELGQQVEDILRVNCSQCHVGQGAQGDFGYLFDMDQLIANDKIVPGSKEDSQLYTRMVGGTMPPAYQRVFQTPTYGQIDVVGQFIDELPESDREACDSLQFLDVDSQIELMAADIQQLDPVTEQPFTRYMTINYSSNAGDCGRALQRQRFALFKGINSVSTETTVTQPVAIDEDETIYRIDIRDYDWDRAIDLEDDGIVDFTDAWEAIVGDEFNAEFMIEYQGDAADDLKADSGTLVPFMPVNVFIQATEFGNLYYTLIKGKANLFDFERDVLGIDTVAEIADDRLMRAGFENSGVSKQERVLNRFDSGIAGGLSYWISFDFDGGNGNGEVNGVSNGFEVNVANESIFDDPLGFAFAGGEAIFNLPNGLQAYYVAAADGTRLAEAPIGVVIDPAQNNGLVTNGASCHSCHNAGMITFTDTVRQYVEENKIDFDNETYESVMEQYPDKLTFDAQMDRDSEIHVAALERAGVPRKTPDAVSRVYLDFRLGNVSLKQAAAEFGVTEDMLRDNLDLLDPRLGPLSVDGAYVDRNIIKATFLDTVCILQNVQENTPVGCQ
jgi:mono/diheme cytochrome c family protein